MYVVFLLKARIHCCVCQLRVAPRLIRRCPAAKSVHLAMRPPLFLAYLCSRDYGMSVVHAIRPMFTATTQRSVRLADRCMVLAQARH